MIIWIASYPKSGNTLIRSLLCAYLFSKDGKFDINLLKNIKQFSSKNLASDFVDNQNYQLRIFKNWIPSQKIINNDKKIHFHKNHNALCTINGNKFTDAFNTMTAIYIVRDPRNLITSLSHHYEIDLKEALDNSVILGAAIDVYSQEPAKNNILFGTKNLVLTPHIAASTFEAQLLVAKQIAEQVSDFFSSGKVINDV